MAGQPGERLEVPAPGEDHGGGRRLHGSGCRQCRPPRIQGLGECGTQRGEQVAGFLGRGQPAVGEQAHEADLPTVAGEEAHPEALTEARRHQALRPRPIGLQRFGEVRDAQRDGRARHPQPLDLVHHDRSVQVGGGAAVPPGADQRVVPAPVLVQQRQPCAVVRQQPAQRLEDGRSAFGRGSAGCRRSVRHLRRDRTCVDQPHAARLGPCLGHTDPRLVASVVLPMRRGPELGFSGSG
jgi:hypothetical protein